MYVDHRDLHVLTHAVPTRRSSDLAALGIQTHHAQADRPTFCARADSEKIVMRSVVIEPGSTEQQYWRDLWRYRELFLVLARSEEHTSELQSLMRISYAVFCLKQKKKQTINNSKRNYN